MLVLINSPRFSTDSDRFGSDILKALRYVAGMNSNETQKGRITSQDIRDARRLIGVMDARKKAPERLEGSAQIQTDNVIAFPANPRRCGARTDRVPPYCPGTFSQVRG